MPAFKTISNTDIKELKEQAKILLVTATNVETSALHACLRPLRPHTRRLTTKIGGHTYYIGRLGGYGVIHVQCQMGSVLPGASADTVAEAITQWGVKAVIMVGIAFGANPEKQHIGDVLVSKTVIPYEVKRVGKNNVIPRGPIPPCGSILLNRFTNSRGWTHALSRHQNARLIPAQLLSGESLIDNKRHLAKLLKEFPQADGGEMEGVGVFASSHKNNTEWILVKGICDFADGKKSLRKTIKQRTAADSAAALCTHVFSQSGAFDALGCEELSNEAGRPDKRRLSVEEVLFEVYDQAYERAFLERNIDREIAAILAHQGIWLSGPTGCGKTNALRRNLSRLQKRFEFIDLSKCVGATTPQVFDALHAELADRIKATDIARVPAAQRNKADFHIGRIAKLIQTNVKTETHFLIDEVPLDGEDFCAFSSGIAAIIITLSNCNVNTAPILLSTIQDPAPGLKHFHAKVHTRLRLLHMPRWTEEEMKSLLALIAKLIPIHLSTAKRNQIIKASDGCPRALKLLLKNWLMFRSSQGWSLEKVISECPDVLHE